LNLPTHEDTSLWISWLPHYIKCVKLLIVDCEIGGSEGRHCQCQAREVPTLVLTVCEWISATLRGPYKVISICKQVVDKTSYLRFQWVRADSVISLAPGDEITAFFALLEDTQRVEASFPRPELNL
jgi:hypothetical protein